MMSFAVLALVLVVAWVARNRFYHGLHKYPGPVLASLTNWWRVYDVWTTHATRHHLQLHEKHGDVVRLGPNLLSFADPKAIKIIYGLKPGFLKSKFYNAHRGVRRGTLVTSLFASRDEKWHAEYRRCLTAAFSLSSLKSYEPLVDSSLDVFLDRTATLFAETGKTCDLAEWLYFYAFDLIGELTWGQRIGFVEQDADIEGIAGLVASYMHHNAIVGQMPWLDYVTLKNPIRLLMQRWGFQKASPIERFAAGHYVRRAPELAKIKAYGLPESAAEAEGRPVDMLAKFAQAAHNHPQLMTDQKIIGALVTMVIAGSETTSVSMSAVLYYLMRSPAAYQKLMAELDGAVASGQIADRPSGRVSFFEAQGLPYLGAVIAEANRLHPVGGLILERVVPPGGADILGQHVPGGTLVGCNAWVVHRRKAVFGEDVEAFRPERWLEASPDRLREMKAAMFDFGYGARTCIGKNISILEVHKLVPNLLLRFKIELEDPSRPWDTFDSWVVRPLGFNVKFKPRAQTTRSEK